MQQIIFFFIRNKNFLLFCLLFAISIGFTINSHSYHKTKFVNSANFLSGGIYSAKSNITAYFDLKEENTLLVEENIRLREQIQLTKAQIATQPIDSSIIVDSQFSYVGAKVINNSYSKSKNRITLKAGSNDSIKADMGVITSKGIVGIVSSVSRNYSSVQSILNTKSQINARLEKTNHFGTLVWDTKDPNTVQLIEIPRLAPVALGDTIVTDGKSTIFPEGIMIGTVQQFDLLEDEDYYQINVKLFNDMTSLRHVYIIDNKDREEIESIENGLDDVE